MKRQNVASRIPTLINEEADFKHIISSISDEHPTISQK
jgi:hypothetical protein